MLTELQKETLQECISVAVHNIFGQSTTEESLEYMVFFSQQRTEQEFVSLVDRAHGDILVRNLTNLRSLQTERPLEMQMDYGNGMPTFNVVIGGQVPLNLERIGPEPAQGEISNLLFEQMETISDYVRVLNASPVNDVPRLSFAFNINNEELRDRINILNRAVPLLFRLGAAANRQAQDGRAVAVRRIEAAIVELINFVVNGQNNIMELRWLLANRMEISQIFELVSRKREEWNIPYADNHDISRARAEIRNSFESLEQIYNDPEIFSNGRSLYGWYYGKRAFGAAAGVTGLSAVSFLAPPVGVVVTPTTGGISLVGAIACTLYGRNLGTREACHDAEVALRNEYRRVVP